ncbi:hypothetical protein P4O66_000626 [Electrophorus voltai]|uniref:NTR domain-containing protein n=1 Tax=Electrophorus voltai TaxID=2609070 RepID=A0AAD8ZEQ4_9TELE|nr:hypothetical protein P4O66_000626 [Electrophorus voltai]
MDFRETAAAGDRANPAPNPASRQAVRQHRHYICPTRGALRAAQCQPSHCDSYCKASKGKLKINMKKYCKKDYAVQVHILKSDKAGEWWKFTVNIISVYKQGENRIRRGDQLLWVRAKDIGCKCPKIKTGKKYLLLGNDEDSPGQGGMVADKASLVIQWRDTWARRLRKFQQREKKGKCKKA